MQSQVQSGLKPVKNKQQHIFQLTFIKKSNNRRPKTSSLNRPIYTPNNFLNKYSQNDPIYKMKQLKEQAKKMEKQYISMLTNVKQSEKSINQNYREAQRTKVTFLKLYQTKKIKTYPLISQSNAKQIDKNIQSKLETTLNVLKSKSKSNSLQINKKNRHIWIILENRFRNKNKQFFVRKQKFQKKKLLKTTELYNTSRNSFVKIKESHQNKIQRRKHIKSVCDVRSKHNYWKKASEQVMMLKQYEKIFKDLQFFDESFNKEISQPRGKTSQTARSSRTGFFITQKK